MDVVKRLQVTVASLKALILAFKAILTLSVGVFGTTSVMYFKDKTLKITVIKSIDLETLTIVGYSFSISVLLTVCWILLSFAISLMELKIQWKKDEDLLSLNTVELRYSYSLKQVFNE